MGDGERGGGAGGRGELSPRRKCKKTSDDASLLLVTFKAFKNSRYVALRAVVLYFTDRASTKETYHRVRYPAFQHSRQSRCLGPGPTQPQRFGPRCTIHHETWQKRCLRISSGRLTSWLSVFQTPSLALQSPTVGVRVDLALCLIPQGTAGGPDEASHR